MSILSGNNKNKVCEVLIKEYPQAKCALDYDTEYHLLVAVMLSAQTTDVSVNKVTPRLFELAPDAYAMCGLSQEEMNARFAETYAAMRAFNEKNGLSEIDPESITFAKLGT